MRFISLFAGIGGFDLGFERAGLTCVAQVEIDDRARDVLHRHYPDVPKFADVRTVGKHNLPAADVVCGGFPCQDLSVAGSRAGFGGERSSLFFEMVRITDELRPAFLVWENVPGLLSSRNGADFWRVLSELDAIGYCGAWTGLDAQFYGLAQRRRRIFGVFARNDIGAGRCAEILSLAQRLPGNLAARREAGTGVTNAITKSLGAGGADDNDAQGGLLVMQEQGGFGLRHFNDLAPTLQSEGGTHQGGPSYLPMVFEPRIARNGRGAPDTIVPPLKARNGDGGKGDGAPLVAFSSKDDGGDAGELAPTLRSMNHKDSHINGGGQVAIAYTLPSPAQLAPKVGANAYSPSKSGSGAQADFAIPQQSGVRRLTPTECERLQGFPDGWTDGQADSTRYRQLGNAVAVPVTEWIGRRLTETQP